MNWLAQTVASSIGKKWIMALTGLGFSIFLTTHLAGNLFIYGGRDAFNSYAEHLHSLGPLVTLFELGLLTFAILHIGSGLILFYQNFASRPQRYAVNKSGGGRTIGSRTMAYTGILILVFVVFHLLNFTFADKTGTTIYEIVSRTFTRPVTVVLYVLAMAVVAVHVSHGFWSAFQTLGANHPKYMPFIRGAGIVFSLFVGLGFGLLPIYLLSIA
ncbi:MAG: succinate dehydrogenase cytochrome b subunit [Desulfobacterales bacterium]